MSTEQNREALFSPEALVSIAACFALIWWDSFHEIGRLIFSIEPFRGGETPFFSYLSCLMQPIGAALGCVVAIICTRKGSDFVTRPWVVAAVFVAEAVLHVSYYASIVFAAALPLACVLYCLMSACFSLNMAYFLVVFSRMGTKATVHGVLAGVASMGVVNCLLLSVTAREVPLAVTGLIYLAVLFASYAFATKARDAVARCNGAGLTEGYERKAGSFPFAPVFHLLTYGVVFGVLHTLSGRLAAGPFNINIPLAFSCMITVVILVVLFFREDEGIGSNTEIWSKMRSTVFPLAVVGFMLVPLVSNGDIALAVIGSGQILYDAILVIACVIVVGRTFIHPVYVAATVFLFRNIGMSVGIAGIAFAGGFELLSTSAGLSFAGVVPTLLLTAATFWVGSDETIRKIWGLRKNLSPKRYADEVLKAKCAVLSKSGCLTAKESEILYCLAQGRRASEMKDEMHVSINTVRSHIKHVYAKLGVHSVDDIAVLLKAVVIEDKDVG
ncbi:MAG: helix-turn-helix transcriptional regulator [Slackia sp.]|nr:helix-turn-helix transcriptional regulator [Slackia sp.]